MTIRSMFVRALGLLAVLATVSSRADAQSRAPVIQQRVTLDPSHPVGFHVLVVPDTVYVGQQATYEMGVFISESAQQRMRRNPEVVPAELRGVLAYDLGGPQSLPAVVQGGLRAFPHVLQRALFPLAGGRIVIPASQLSYALPRSASYFSREESAIVRAGEVSLFVKPLPDDGKPADFSGAVGDLSIRALVDVTRVRAGNPVVLTVRVGGRGNVKLWPRPDLHNMPASVVPAGERVQVDTSGQYVRGTKEFDWLVTPEREGRLVIPVVEYPFFDPYDEAYRTTSSDSLVLSIGAGEFTPDAAAASAREVLSVRRDDRGPLPPDLPDRPFAWALMAMAPLPALWWRRVRRLKAARLARGDAEPNREPSTVVTSAAPAADPVRVAAASLRRSLIGTLARQLDAPGTAFVERRSLERRLRRRGVTRETTAEVMQLLRDLDEAAWSAATGIARSSIGTRATLGDSWPDRIKAVTQSVEDEAMPPSGRDTGHAGATKHGAFGGRSKLVVFCIAAAGALSLAVGSVGNLHARGAAFQQSLAQYDVQQYADAAVGFLAIARAEPRDADAWANAGTAAWAAGDTVQSVVGWHRALRLEPRARDVRDRLDLVSRSSQSGIAHVANRPRDLAATITILLWCLAWGLLAFGYWTAAYRDTPETKGTDLAMRSRLAQRWAAVVFVLCVGTATWHWQSSGAREGKNLSVVSHLEPLRLSPGDAAGAIGGTMRGDLVKTGEEQLGAAGARWVAVEHADGRTGWLPARALLALTAP